MIRNKDSQSIFYYSLVVALVIHAVIIAFLKYNPNDFEFLTNLAKNKIQTSQPMQLDNIKIIKPEEVEKLRKVGIKDGRKDLFRPDLTPKIERPAVAKTPAIGKPGSLSLEKLAPKLSQAKPVVKNTTPHPATDPVVKTSPEQNALSKSIIPTATDKGKHFYFNYKNQKVIQRSSEQEILKEEAGKNYSAPMNKATERISNFEIRYERPEGVSEDELNSDEKAYYSFYVRSYKNYFSKIYSNYEKIVVQKPGLATVFDKRHLLIGKIDYDENGNIITVRILKSSDSDDLHYFFEETLKEMNQPNPPKIFTKNRKQFSIYYQLQIN